MLPLVSPCCIHPPLLPCCIPARRRSLPPLRYVYPVAPLLSPPPLVFPLATPLRNLSSLLCGPPLLYSMWPSLAVAPLSYIWPSLAVPRVSPQQLVLYYLYICVCV